MAGPELQPLLGRPAGGKKSASMLGRLEALVLILAMLVGYWYGVHALEVFIHIHPTLTVVFPLCGAAALASLLPPILYLSFAGEFSGLHPAWPPHYLFLSKRLLRALSANGRLKVSAKEL